MLSCMLTLHAWEMLGPQRCSPCGSSTAVSCWPVGPHIQPEYTRWWLLVIQMFACVYAERERPPLACSKEVSVKPSPNHRGVSVWPSNASTHPHMTGVHFFYDLFSSLDICCPFLLFGCVFYHCAFQFDFLNRGRTEYIGIYLNCSFTLRFILHCCKTFWPHIKQFNV